MAVGYYLGGVYREKVGELCGGCTAAAMDMLESGRTYPGIFDPRDETVVEQVTFEVLWPE